MAFWSVLLFIWMISGSLRLSQNFVKNWKFSWPRSLAKFQILTNFSRLSFQPCEVDCNPQKWYSGVVSCVDLNDFWKFEVESKFCEKLKIFMTAVLSEISDFDQHFKTFTSDLWMNCKSQKWHSGVFSMFIWMISGSFRFSQNFVKNLKFS